MVPFLGHKLFRFFFSWNYIKVVYRNYHALMGNCHVFTVLLYKCPITSYLDPLFPSFQPIRPTPPDSGRDFQYVCSELTTFLVIPTMTTKGQNQKKKFLFTLYHFCLKYLSFYDPYQQYTFLLLVHVGLRYLLFSVCLRSNLGSRSNKMVNTIETVKVNSSQNNRYFVSFNMDEAP